MAHTLIFDSGVGGLSVAAEIRVQLPGLSLTYAADDAFRPYGNKPEQALRERLPGLLWTLAEMTTPDVIVIACNTASTTALEDIRKEVKIPVVGVVPAIKPAAKLTRTGTIGVLGTPGTVRREYVENLMADHASHCRIIRQGSVGLVALAEKKLSGETIAIPDIRAEIDDLFSKRGGKEIDTVVLACTHFPLLKDELQAASPHPVNWIDSGAAIAKRVKSILGNKALEKSLTQDKEIAFLIGPNPPLERKKAFGAYGFNRVIGLMA